MKIVETYIVVRNHRWHQLFLCEDGKWFITHTGMFNESVFVIKPIIEDEAFELINKK